MTDAELSTLESQIGYRLPSDYCELQRHYPFELGNSNAACALFAELPTMLAWNAELCEGEFAELWRKNWLAIGWSPVGDTFFLDLTESPTRVYGWDHETHAVYDVAPTLAAFVAEVETWSSAGALTPDQIAWQADQARRMRLGMWVTAAILLACVLFPLILGLLIAR